MRANIANELERLKSEDTILRVLRNLKPTTFNEILQRTNVSSRTLSKHLGRLVDRSLIEKQDRKYRITAVGVEYLMPLAHQLEKFREHRKRLTSAAATLHLRDLAVEMTRISPSETCIGIIHVSVPRQPQWNSDERCKMDRALTQVMRTITHSVPKDCKEYNVTITGTLR
jgi:DNA-binding HxlR family transcriptional regulator